MRHGFPSAVSPAPIDITSAGITVHAPKARRSLPQWLYSEDGYGSDSSDQPPSRPPSTGSVGSVGSVATPITGPGPRARFASFSSLVTAGSTTQPAASSSASSPARRLIKYAFTFPAPTVSAYPTLSKLSRPFQNPTTFTIAIAILVRLALSLGSHSGMATPPMFGDFEAQRHWMELTLRLPVSQWYNYELEWWGLDYPPLTAYVSLFWGWVGELVFSGKERGWFALDASRGNEDPSLKVFMRWTVVLSDALVYIPALVWWTSLRIRSKRSRSTALLVTILQPSLLLVDFGHFQYNSVMLGFTLLSLCCFQTSRDGLGCLFFVLALSFKQMALYYAPAIGSYLLAKCIYTRSFPSFVKFGAVTTMAFLIIFLPFIPSSLQQVIHRIFPLARGLFEDKVANFWCATDVVVKWRRRISRDGLVLLSTGLTVLFFAPSALVFLWPRKDSPVSPRVLPFALLTSSLAFFLFSFQVHEKTILVPMLALIAAIPPVSTAPTDASKFDWNVFGEDTHGVFILANNVACFSMWPLLKRDGLGLQYFTVIAFWNYLAYRPSSGRSLIGAVSKVVYTAIIVLHLLEAVVAVPARYPDLWPVLNVLVSTPVFAALWLWSAAKMYMESWAGGGFGFGGGEGSATTETTDGLASPATTILLPPMSSRTRADSRPRHRKTSTREGLLRARSPLAGFSQGSLAGVAAGGLGGAS
ncbi:glycosyltransferase family 57 protein [Cylindrobasidium torrendii FP15055 ss-10]|uniref:Alpha-1,3-glucosyltransferase n=1 Tax=Cylindrobasidium torrendii FP15055 ss-10 TaxID=1314674 RepID=A0A0D7BTP6_9AGAR|nr:glycosyltransferase family 57 protein [Cylindrobasidium torrendii FP15055 ss-10]